MIYEYKCSCGKILSIEKSMKEDIPSSIACNCGKEAIRFWGSSIHIPEHFKATSEMCNADNYANLDNLKRKFKSSRPTGRESKIYY